MMGKEILSCTAVLRNAVMNMDAGILEVVAVLSLMRHILDGMKREVKEGYGVDALEIKFLGVDEIFRKHNERDTHWICIQYKVRVDRSKVINAEPDKHEELTWVRLDSLPTPLHSRIMPSLEKYKDRL